MGSALLQPSKALCSVTDQATTEQPPSPPKVTWSARSSNASPLQGAWRELVGARDYPRAGRASCAPPVRQEGIPVLGREMLRGSSFGDLQVLVPAEESERDAGSMAQIYVADAVPNPPSLP